ncbi:MAG TPA: hypothetical protein VJM32_02040 [Candidatus Saccharimonadales bacterium]|nr:hypothetical protein [Candidatus Saccharimonadales bacterium]
MHEQQAKVILRHYGLDDSEALDYAVHSHGPDMWSHTFKLRGKAYVLVEVEAVNDDLESDEYARIKEDLDISKENMTLVLPEFEQMRTTANQAGVGIDGHRRVADQEEVEERQKVYDEAVASRYFPPMPQDELPNSESKLYKNPNGLDTETTWVLFELKQST